MNTSNHGSTMNTSTHGSTIHRTTMTFQKSEPAKYDYEMPSRSQHGSTTNTSSNTETTTTKAAEETNERPFWENPTDDDDDDATVDTFFAKLFRRAEGKEDASTTNPANDNDDGTVDTFFAKLLNKDGRDDEASVSAESTSGEQQEQRNYGEFVQYMDFLELVEFMNALKTKTSGMPPQKIESKVEQLEKLMEKTKVGQQQSDDDDSNSTWKFLEFLMGKKNDETPESKVHYQNFLWWLSSPPGTNPTSFQSEKGPSKEDIWKDIVDGMAEKEERVSVKVTMTALWNYIVTPPFVEQSSSSSSSSSTKQSGIWSWFGYGASATPKVEEQQPKEEANDGIDKAQELEEDANTSTASSDNHIV